MENYSNIENIIDTAQKEIYLFGNKQKGWRYSPIVYIRNLTIINYG